MNQLPPQVGHHLLETYGQPTAIEPLDGLSTARIWRLFFNEDRLILKCSRQPRERFFYDNILPHLPPATLSVPRRHWSAHLPSGNWLLLEDIPTPLPRSRWLADPDALGLLRRLHHLPVRLPIDHSHLFRPQWTEQMTAAALAWFPAGPRLRNQPILRRLRETAHPLFARQCYISGDPNPLNWGMRQDGTLVLFDWERFGPGTPALDLAITLPALGDATSFEMAARHYPEDDTGDAIGQLARAIALARV